MFREHITGTPKVDIISKELNGNLSGGNSLEGKFAAVAIEKKA